MKFWCSYGSLASIFFSLLNELMFSSVLLRLQESVDSLFNAIWWIIIMLLFCSDLSPRLRRWESFENLFIPQSIGLV